MAATVVTREPLDSGVSSDDIKRETALNVKAGCVRCWVETRNGERILCTEWNVIGEND